MNVNTHKFSIPRVDGWEEEKTLLLAWRVTSCKLERKQGSGIQCVHMQESHTQEARFEFAAETEVLDDMVVERGRLRVRARVEPPVESEKKERG